MRTGYMYDRPTFETNELQMQYFFEGIIVYVALGCVFILIVSLVFIATTTPK